MFGLQGYASLYYYLEGIDFRNFIITSKTKPRYPYFPATDDTVALTHIGELLGLAGLREAATSLGRKLSIQGLKETSFTVQQIVRKQRNSSKHPIETGEISY